MQGSMSIPASLDLALVAGVCNHLQRHGCKGYDTSHDTKLSLRRAKLTRFLAFAQDCLYRGCDRLYCLNQHGRSDAVGC